MPAVIHKQPSHRLRAEREAMRAPVPWTAAFVSAAAATLRARARLAAAYGSSVRVRGIGGRRAAARRTSSAAIHRATRTFVMSVSATYRRVACSLRRLVDDPEFHVSGLPQCQELFVRLSCGRGVVC
jgi:hypothetical protein